jgi:hypothetical protein
MAATVLAGLKVLSPKALIEHFGAGGEIKASLGNFGQVIYGSSIVNKMIANLISLFVDGKSPLSE